ncbi:hypothetical protein [Paraburkholderia sp. HP33-1]|uniref:hypothetical protein n=1 Tax=Paraburkholderia sp. HP33-1 TaxID=2883243 RepID=UPI001F3BEE0F|nr:hypothetical protein [Paraburkholderia sp. HP33-1]
MSLSRNCCAHDLDVVTLCGTNLHGGRNLFGKPRINVAFPPPQQSGSTNMQPWRHGQQLGSQVFLYSEPNMMDLILHCTPTIERKVVMRWFSRRLASKVSAWCAGLNP